MKKFIFTAAFSILCLLPNRAFSQFIQDTFRLTVCNHHWKTGEPIPGVIYRTGKGNPIVESVDSQGFCATLRFVPAASVQGFLPVASKQDTDFVSGVNVVDLCMISRHILGVEPLQQDAQTIAADFNQSGTVTTFDIVKIRKMLLGLHRDPSVFTFSRWRFLNPLCLSPNQHNPFSGDPNPCEYQYQPGTFRDSISMLAMEMGDVDGSLDEPPIGSVIEFAMPDADLQQGQIFEIPVWPKSDFEATYLQLGIEFDPTVCEILELRKGALTNLDHYSYALQQAAGALKILLPTYGSFSAGTPLFFIKIRAAEAFSIKDKIEISDSPFPSLLADQECQPFVIQRIFEKANARERTDFQRDAILSPNPFFEKTTLRFTLETAAPVRFELFDATGRQVCFFEKNLPGGEQAVELPGEIFPANGLYFLKMTAAGKFSILKLAKN